jgi:hypothetical protein
VVALLLLAACGGGTPTAGTSTSPRHPLPAAILDCDVDLLYARTSNNYGTLTLDGRGTGDDGGLRPADIVCVLDKLRVTDDVQAHIDATRAIDGMQTDHWGSYKARWTYSTQHGLLLTISQL